MTNFFINFNLSVKTTSFKEPTYKGPKGGHKALKMVVYQYMLVIRHESTIKLWQKNGLYLR